MATRQATFYKYSINHKSRWGKNDSNKTIKESESRLEQGIVYLRHICIDYDYLEPDQKLF